MPYGYITKLSDKLTREHVRYNNRYGTAIAADIYYVKDIDKNAKYPALIVGASYGGTKEQGPCVMPMNWHSAALSFWLLTKYIWVNQAASQDVFHPQTYLLKASVPQLIIVPFVDREKIGVIGICGSGGFALSAASVDTRIKAIATASMYDITDIRGMQNLSKKQIDEMKDKLTRQRWADFENGQPKIHSILPRNSISKCRCFT